MSHDTDHQKMCDEFRAKFPNLFSNGCYLPGVGWRKLMWELSEKLEALIVALPDDPVYGKPHVVQTKEKFGGLRWYMSSETPEMSAAIREAEEKSYKTCEWCGAPGTRRPGGWILTLCDSCQAERERR